MLSLSQFTHPAIKAVFAKSPIPPQNESEGSRKSNFGNVSEEESSCNTDADSNESEKESFCTNDSSVSERDSNSDSSEEELHYSDTETTSPFCECCMLPSFII